MSYSPYYDSYSRPRRNSFGYRSTTPSYYDPLITKPLYRSSTPSSYSSYYDHYGSPYTDPYGEYSRPYPLYASSNHSSHYIPSPYSDSYLDVYPPVVQSMSLGRPRSSLSYRSRTPSFSDPWRGRGTGIISFKRKGGFMAGISLGEAQANVKLAGSDSYTYSELGVDSRGKIFVKIIWPGYTPLNYEIPVDGYGGRVDLQSLTRRIGRAVTHYLQANVVPVPWNRVEIQQMEAIGIGSWLLKMTTN